MTLSAGPLRVKTNVKAAVKNIEEAIKRDGQQLLTSNVDTPMNITNSPELDVTKE